VEQARVWTGEALEATAGQTILEALFGPLEGGVQFHGINMFRTACAQVHGRDPGSATIVLECPASDDVQRAFWLWFAHELLGWQQAPPCLFWTDVDSPDSRLLIALGSPGVPGILHFLADPTVEAQRLWPMRTERAQSIEAGRRALGPEQLHVLEPPAATAAALLRGLIAG
jgi:type VI secretion system protein ImpM